MCFNDNLSVSIPSIQTIGTILFMIVFNIIQSSPLIVSKNSKVCYFEQVMYPYKLDHLGRDRTVIGFITTCAVSEL